MYARLKHRSDVLAAFELGIERQKGKDSTAAQLIATNLKTAANLLKKVVYQNAGMSTHAGNSVDRAADSQQDQAQQASAA